MWATQHAGALGLSLWLSWQLSGCHLGNVPSTVCLSVVTGRLSSVDPGGRRASNRVDSTRASPHAPSSFVSSSTPLQHQHQHQHVLQWRRPRLSPRPVPSPVTKSCSVRDRRVRDPTPIIRAMAVPTPRWKRPRTPFAGSVPGPKRQPPSEDSSSVPASRRLVRSSVHSFLLGPNPSLIPDTSTVLERQRLLFIRVCTVSDTRPPLLCTWPHQRQKAPHTHTVAHTVALQCPNTIPLPRPGSDRPTRPLSPPVKPNESQVAR